MAASRPKDGKSLAGLPAGNDPGLRAISVLMADLLQSAAHELCGDAPVSKAALGGDRLLHLMAATRDLDEGMRTILSGAHREEALASLRRGLRLLEKLLPHGAGNPDALCVAPPDLLQDPAKNQWRLPLKPAVWLSLTLERVRELAPELGLMEPVAWKRRALAATAIAWPAWYERCVVAAGDRESLVDDGPDTVFNALCAIHQAARNAFAGRGSVAGFIRAIDECAPVLLTVNASTARFLEAGDGISMREILECFCPGWDVPGCEDAMIICDAVEQLAEPLAWGGQRAPFKVDDIQPITAALERLAMSRVKTERARRILGHDPASAPRKELVKLRTAFNSFREAVPLLVPDIELSLNLPELLEKVAPEDLSGRLGTPRLDKALDVATERIDQILERLTRARAAEQQPCDRASSAD